MLPVAWTDDEDDAGPNEALAAIVCLANPAKSDRNEIQATWFSLV